MYLEIIIFYQQVCDVIKISIIKLHYFHSKIAANLYDSNIQMKNITAPL